MKRVIVVFATDDDLDPQRVVDWLIAKCQEAAIPRVSVIEALTERDLETFNVKSRELVSR